MCPLCHADADEKGERAGAYSKDELRSMKKSKRSSEDVKGHFPAWEQKKSLLVRMGGCYADTDSRLFSVNEIPQIVVARNEVGLLSLSFELRNRQDQVDGRELAHGLSSKRPRHDRDAENQGGKGLARQGRCRVRIVV
jgi:hypothetical protein